MTNSLRKIGSANLVAACPPVRRGGNHERGEKIMAPLNSHPHTVEQHPIY